MTKEAMGLRERVRNAIHAAHNDPSLYAWFHEMPEKCGHSQGLADAAIEAVLDALKEPSHAVIKAGDDVADTWDYGHTVASSQMEDAWQAMLAAYRAEAGEHREPN